MLNQIILRLIIAVISATVLSIIGNHIGSKLERVPRLLRDGRFSGAQKTKKQKKQDKLEPDDRKAIDASKRSRKVSCLCNNNANNRRNCKAPAEMKGQPKSERRCDNRGNRARSDANIEDRAFSQRRYK